MEERADNLQSPVKTEGSEPGYASRYRPLVESTDDGHEPLAYKARYQSVYTNNSADESTMKLNYPSAGMAESTTEDGASAVAPGNSNRALGPSVSLAAPEHDVMQQGDDDRSDDDVSLNRVTSYTRRASLSTRTTAEAPAAVAARTVALSESFSFHLRADAGQDTTLLVENVALSTDPQGTSSSATTGLLNTDVAHTLSAFPLHGTAGGVASEASLQGAGASAASAAPAASSLLPQHPSSVPDPYLPPAPHNLSPAAGELDPYLPSPPSLKDAPTEWVDAVDSTQWPPAGSTTVSTKPSTWENETDVRSFVDVPLSMTPSAADPVAAVIASGTSPPMPAFALQQSDTGSVIGTTELQLDAVTPEVVATVEHPVFDDPDVLPHGHPAMLAPTPALGIEPLAVEAAASAAPMTSPNLSTGQQLLDDYRIAAAAGLVSPELASLLGLAPPPPEAEDLQHREEEKEEEEVVPLEAVEPADLASRNAVGAVVSVASSAAAAVAANVIAQQQVSAAAALVQRATAGDPFDAADTDDEAPGFMGKPSLAAANAAAAVPQSQQYAVQRGPVSELQLMVQQTVDPTASNLSGGLALTGAAAAVAGVGLAAVGAAAVADQRAAQVAVGPGPVPRGQAPGAVLMPSGQALVAPGALQQQPPLCPPPPPPQHQQQQQHSVHAGPPHAGGLTAPGGHGSPPGLLLPTSMRPSVSPGPGQPGGNLAQNAQTAQQPPSGMQLQPGEAPPPGWPGPAPSFGPQAARGPVGAMPPLPPSAAAAGASAAVVGLQPHGPGGPGGPWPQGGPGPGPLHGNGTLPPRPEFHPPPLQPQPLPHPGAPWPGLAMPAPGPGPALVRPGMGPYGAPEGRGIVGPAVRPPFPTSPGPPPPGAVPMGPAGRGGPMRPMFRPTLPPGAAGVPRPPLLPAPPPSPYPGLLYTEGRDTLGRPVVVLNTAMLPAKAKKNDVLQYVLQQLQPVVQGDYVIVVLSLAMGVKPNAVSSTWALGAYRSLAKPYRKNVKHVVLVQPSAWARALLALTQPFVSKKAAHKVKKVDNLREISEATAGEVKLESLGARFIREIQYGLGAPPLVGLVPNSGPGGTQRPPMAGPAPGPMGPLRGPMPGGGPPPPLPAGYPAPPYPGPPGLQWPPAPRPMAALQQQPGSGITTPVYGPGGPRPAMVGRVQGPPPPRPQFSPGPADSLGQQPMGGNNGLATPLAGAAVLPS